MTDHTDERDPLMDCPRCSGSGEGPADGTRCRTCKGTGLVVNPAAKDDVDDDGDAKYDQWNEEERDR
jgi:RecJ-like exonuclease